MKKLKTILILLISIISYSAFSQNSIKHGLWRGIGIFDTTGARKGFKIDEFFYVKNDSVVRVLGFEYPKDKQTGEVTVNSYINDYVLTQDAKLQKGNLTQTLVIKTDTIAIYENKLSVSFAYFETSASPKIKTVRKNIFGKTFDIGKHIKVTYQNDMTANYHDTNSGRKWASKYQLIEFEDLVFLHDALSPPVLILNSNKKNITGIELDYKFEPKPIEMN